MKTIIIDGTGRTEEHSKTKYLANRVISKLALTDYEVVDLYQIELPFVTTEIIESWASDEGDSRALNLLRQFEAVDQVIFIYPTWNWSVPAIVRTYMDLIIISGRTFGYDNRGKAEGYLTNKQAVLISTTGGKTYGPIKATLLKAQSGDNYMSQVLNTIGISKITTYSIDNTAYDFNDNQGKFSHALYQKKVQQIIDRIN